MKINSEGLTKMKRRGVTIFVKAKDVSMQQKNGFVRVKKAKMEDLAKLNANDTVRLAKAFKLVPKKAKGVKKEDAVELIKKHAEENKAEIVSVISDVLFYYEQQELNKLMEEEDEEE